MKLHLSLALLVLAGSVGTLFAQTPTPIVNSSTYSGLFGPANSEVTAVPATPGLIDIEVGGTKTADLGTYWNATVNGGLAVRVLFDVTKTGAQVKLVNNSLQFNLSNSPNSLLGSLGVGTALGLDWSATATFDGSTPLTLQPNSTYRVIFDVDTGSGLLNSALAITPAFGVELLDGNGAAIGSANNVTLVNILGLNLLNVVGTPNTGRAVVNFTTGATVPSGPAKIRFTGSAALPASLLSIGTNFATVSNLSVSYVDPYTKWIEESGLPTNQWDKEADPDRDGRTNFTEFAVDSDPAVADDENVHVKIGDPDGSGPDTSVFIMTLPVRDGASFSDASGPQKATKDGVIYQIEGSFELVNWTAAVSEVAPDTSYFDSLPDLDSGWSYRSFRVPGQTSDTPRAFLRAKFSY